MRLDRNVGHFGLENAYILTPGSYFIVADHSLSLIGGGCVGFLPQIIRAVGCGLDIPALINVQMTLSLVNSGNSAKDARTESRNISFINTSSLTASSPVFRRATTVPPSESPPLQSWMLGEPATFEYEDSCHGRGLRQRRMAGLDHASWEMAMIAELVIIDSVSSVCRHNIVSQ